MRRSRNLWEKVITFENLLSAAQKACKGKRFRPGVAAFHFDLERQLLSLQRELATRSYRPGPYRTFFLYETKKRQISAAPYRDRVVHHALTNVLEPIFERSFVFDSYACRKGKGSHAAVDRCRHYARRFRYVLKADVRKFFPSIDHEVLKGLVARKVKDPDVLWLVGLLIDHSNAQEPVHEWFAGAGLWTPGERRRGLPIGNQTSQFFANVYLDPLDHWIRDRLGVGGYVRYVDDFLVFGHDKGRLAEVQSALPAFLAGQRLRLHPTKNVVFPAAQGISFLGYRVYPSHRLLVKENVWRFRRRLRRMQRQYARHVISLDDARVRIVSWIGHARQADTYRLRQRLFQEHPFRRATPI
jgi:retron-type reverse transcriptase